MASSPPPRPQPSPITTTEVTFRSLIIITFSPPSLTVVTLLFHPHFSFLLPPPPPLYFYLIKRSTVLLLSPSQSVHPPFHSHFWCGRENFSDLGPGHEGEGGKPLASFTCSLAAGTADPFKFFPLFPLVQCGICVGMCVGVSG